MIYTWTQLRDFTDPEWDFIVGIIIPKFKDFKVMPDSSIINAYAYTVDGFYIKDRQVIWKLSSGSDIRSNRMEDKKPKRYEIFAFISTVKHIFPSTMNIDITWLNDFIVSDCPLPEQKQDVFYHLQIGR